MPTLNPTLAVDTTTSASSLNNVNYLQPNAFKLTIDHKHFQNLEFFCQTVMHPSLSSNPIEVPYKRISSIPFAGDKLTFGELTAMIIVDENLNAYTEMYKWLERTIELQDNTPLYRTASKPPTYADITLNILSSNNNKVRQIRYIDCIPTSLGDMTLESTSGDVSFITFPASFRFSYFELK
jgi:hypothetical protein|tara:strand:- start:3223 stop:3765 length:543 start_codon:yes stop_codon:yes gene_type:complete